MKYAEREKVNTTLHLFAVAVCVYISSTEELTIIIIILGVERLGVSPLSRKTFPENTQLYHQHEINENKK